MHNEVSRTLMFSYDFSVRNKPAQSNTISSPCSNSFHFKLEIVILAENFYLMYFECLLSLIYCANGGSCTLNRAFLRALHPCLWQKRHRVPHCNIVGWMISWTKDSITDIFSILRLGQVIPC